VIDRWFADTVEDIDDVANDFAALVVGNAIKGALSRKSWKQSASLKASKKHRDLPDDEVAAEFTSVVFFNCVYKSQVCWKESRSYKTYAEHTFYEMDTYDMNVKMKQLFVTVKSRTNGANAFYEAHPWLKKTPQETREASAFKAAAAHRSASSNYAAGNITKYDFRYKSKKDEDKHGYTIGVGKGVRFANGKLSLFPSFLGESIRFYDSPPISGESQCECEVTKDALGDYWLVVPFFAKKKTTRTSGVVAIDPGLAEPWACYSPEGPGSDGFILGERMNDKLKELRTKASALDSVIATAADADKRELALRRLRLIRRTKRVRDDWHWKIINDITKEFGTILLPRLETGRLCGGLRAKSNRKMFGISHGMFYDRLEFRCSETNAMLVDANESYSTVTCGHCGLERLMRLDERVFECARCGLRCHRDLHAARNIYIRWVIKTILNTGQLGP
jgi:transposase